MSVNKHKSAAASSGQNNTLAATYKSYCRNMLILAFVSLVFGLVMVIRPDYSFTVIKWSGGIVSFAYIVAQIVDYSISDEANRSETRQLAIAMAVIALAVFVLQKPELVRQLTNVIAAVIFCFQAGYQLQLNLLLLKLEYKYWWVLLLTVLSCLGFGIYALVLPGGLTKESVLIIGILFLLSAVFNLIIYVLLHMEIKKLNKVKA